MKKLLLALLFVASTAHAACDHLYPEPLTSPIVVELCNTAYVSLYSPSKRAVIAVSERLIPSPSLGNVTRIDRFHADPRITLGPKPSEYIGSGYDKGHMAPADDASTFEEMDESFLMTNMTPQNPTLNRGAWKSLETKVRNIAVSATSPVFVVTIAEYKGTKMMGSIPVPSGYWKIVYVNGVRTFYYADNTATARVVKRSPVSVNGLLLK